MTLLYQVEQETARRCGPFLDDLGVSVGLSLTRVQLPTQQSTLDLGDELTGRYFLRRGLMDDGTGTMVPAVLTLALGIAPNPPTTGPFLAADRVRRVASYDPSSGIVEVDRPWTQPVGPSELIEIHYLDPDRELKLAVVKGLERCFVEDRSTLTTTGQATERDLTAIAPWITQRDQVKNAQWNYPGAFQNPSDIAWVNPFYKAGHVWLGLSPDPFPNEILVTARRPLTMATPATPANRQVQTPPAGATILTLESLLMGTPMEAGTFLPHGLTTGNRIYLEFLYTPVGMVGTYTITVVNDHRFQLDDTIELTPFPTGGATSGTAWLIDEIVGPPFDERDDIPVSLAYAAAAGHVEAWRRFPGKLVGGAQVGLFPTQAMAATEFSKQTDANYAPSPSRPGFDQPFPAYSGVQRA